MKNNNNNSVQTPSLLYDIETYVKAFFEEHKEQEFVFHSYEHTLEVVANVKTLSQAEGISEGETKKLVIAAWFHDTGYHLCCHTHEEKSAKIAREFLESKMVDRDFVDDIVNYILATKVEHEPVNIQEKIIKDADLFHLGTKDFHNKCEVLRKEINQIYNTDYNKKQWLEKSIAFLQKHKYHTAYAIKYLAPVKAEHLTQIEKSLIDIKKKKKKKEKRLNESYVRGVETMFRVMALNNINLSDMADRKANIMISVNSAIISVIFYLTSRQLIQDYMLPGTFLFALSSLSSVVFAILATRPNIMEGRFTREDVVQGKTNLLFFGNFHDVPLDEYMWAMKETMKRKDASYENLIKDTHSLSKVLAKKYRLVRTSYTVFMYGIIISSAVFLFTVLSFGEFGF